tara:strand:- start:65 stop:310 length:246 start_codon:yes stop_codon:yes gene_type:complete
MLLPDMVVASAPSLVGPFASGDRALDLPFFYVLLDLQAALSMPRNRRSGEAILLTVSAEIFVGGSFLISAMSFSRHVDLFG